jgi:anti-sigma regulatory factor (Ser/Thr protein kinase)
VETNEEIRTGPGTHLVQFYDDETALVSVVSEYLARALTEGATAVVFADEPHCDLFCGALRATGLDVDTAAAETQLSIFHASATVERLLVDGAPDPLRFDAAVGSRVRAAAAQGRPVVAYGEMVAYLWENGNVIGAIELEKLWNELAETVPFSLLCAYPWRLMESPDTADAFTEICDAHTCVVAGAPFADDAEASRRFPRAQHALGHARRFVTETLAAWARPELRNDAELLVTELATNALVHAGSGFTVSLSRVEGGVRIAVGDVRSSPPEHRDAETFALGGRGLHLVATLARDWGHTVVPGGKLVWAELATSQGAALVSGPGA